MRRDSSRVLRGGSWLYDVLDDLRASACGGGVPGFWSYGVGFRCVAAVSE